MSRNRTHVRNFLETLENLGQDQDGMTENDLVAIGRELYERFTKSGQDDSAIEVMDSVRIIVLLAAGVPTCMVCGRPAHNGCDCPEEDKRVVTP